MVPTTISFSIWALGFMKGCYVNCSLYIRHWLPSFVYVLQGSIMKFTLLLTSTLLFSLPIFAATPPSKDTVKQVLDYYYDADNVAPVIVDYKVCEKIEKNQCIGVIDINAVPKDQPVNIWVQYLVPNEKGSMVLVQVNNKGITRNTRERTLPRTLRYRDNFKQVFNREGVWEVKFFYEDELDIQELQQLTVNVK